jgi:hypothetical protein
MAAGTALAVVCPEGIEDEAGRLSASSWGRPPHGRPRAVGELLAQAVRRRLCHHQGPSARRERVNLHTGTIPEGDVLNARMR